MSETEIFALETAKLFILQFSLRTATQLREGTSENAIILILLTLSGIVILFIKGILLSKRYVIAEKLFGNFTNSTDKQPLKGSASIVVILSGNIIDFKFEYS